MPFARLRATRLPAELHAALAADSIATRQEAERRTKAALSSSAPHAFSQKVLQLYLPALLQHFQEARLSISVDESTVGQEHTMLAAAWSMQHQLAAWLPVQARGPNNAVHAIQRAGLPIQRRHARTACTEWAHVCADWDI